MLMSFVCLHDRKEIERFLRENVYLHIYSIGDLDEFFWPYTTWFGLKTDGNIDAIVLLYLGLSLPTLLALSEERDAIKALLESIHHLLPHRFYAHLSPGLEAVLARDHDLEPHGEHYKMGLRDEAAISCCDCSGVIRLDGVDMTDIQEFYKESYPGNWFDPRMLKTRQYFGLKKDGVFVSMSGVHVHSPEYKVAALGNIATLPSHRGRGYGKRVTARLGQSLLKEVSHIGLNVNADNKTAISLYEKLGFEIVASYGEFMIQRRS
jgi:ribosomal protein S18 acetylase RimI-like enzyme